MTSWSTSCRSWLVPMVKEILENEMIVPPEWGKRIPLACETGVGETYADAK